MQIDMAMEIKMPKYVDSQIQVLWWEVDQFLIFMAAIGIGLLMHQFLIAVVFNFVSMPMITKFKRASLDGMAMHVMHGSGLMPLNKEFTDALEMEYYQ